LLSSIAFHKITMGCVSSKSGGPRAIVSSKIPGSKTDVPKTTLELANAGNKEIKLRKHNTDAFVDNAQMEVKETERVKVEVPPIDVDGVTAEVNGDRRRLSIMKSNHQNPRKNRVVTREIQIPNESNLSETGVDLKDPGEDIGNGAFGENGECTALKLTYSCVTRPGNDPVKRQKENQDTYCVQSGVGKDSESFVVCVYDGHGPNGALASNFVRERMIKAWTEMGLGQPSCQNEEEIRRIVHNGCVEVNHRLATSNIDVYVSGSTGIMGVVKKNNLFVANVGDSRAVLGRVSVNGKLEAVDLSEDQKPDRPDEHARIIRYGGRVFEWGVPRVWQRDVDMPGLAMARSFGDLAAEAVGVFAEPEITCTTLTKNDKFLIFATDGVWEFLSSTDVINIIGKHMSNKEPGLAARDACVEVILSSVAKWNAVEDVVDDSTCVIIALDFNDDQEQEEELKEDE